MFMTCSILARCPRTGRFGLATASYSILIGMYCDGAVRPNVGATFTQAAPDCRNDRLALNLLVQGYSAQRALAEVLANDAGAEFRQIGIVDREGEAAVHTGSKIVARTDSRTGDGWAVLGAGVAGQPVIDAIAASFESQPDDELEERLLAALEAGRDAGGLAGGRGPLPERSVALIVFGKRDFSDIDLRVDMHDGAIAELRRLYTEFKPHAAYYLERALSPRNAIPSMEFADMLKNAESPKEGA
jgi:uncharacterized Ntn-hydrolase superfamily protein